MRVGDGLVTQSEAVLGLDQGLVDHLLLLVQQGEPAFCHHQTEIALCGGQHQRLLGSVPFQFGHVSADVQLPALGAPFRTDEWLPGTD